jgi:hypothetical protein
MLTYFNAVVSGEAEPFWPHVVLLLVSILAAFTVGFGIILESPKYSAAVHRLATWLVLGGIAVESLCTVFLFVFDESISSKQQSTIIALETRLAPRAISSQQRDRITEKMKMFAGQEFSGRVASGSEDAWDLWGQISLALELAGWKKLPPVPPMATPPYGQPATITMSAMPGVMIWFPAVGWNDIHPRAVALAEALRDNGNGVLAAPGPTADNSKIIIVEIGPNPHQPASIYRDSPAP